MTASMTCNTAAPYGFAFCELVHWDKVRRVIDALP